MGNSHKRSFLRFKIQSQPVLLLNLICFLGMLTMMPSAQASSAHLELVARDADGRLLQHVVASLHPKESIATVASTDIVSIMDQRNLQFAPTVLAVQTGTTVKFPNDDDVRHHVYSFSHPNAFELKLYHGESGANQIFQHEGVVVLGCNIHDGMLGYLRVVDTPYFSTSNVNGYVAIPDVPPGNYELQIWHPDIGMTVVRKSLTVKSGISRMEMTVAVDRVDIPPVKAAHPLQSLFRD